MDGTVPAKPSGFPYASWGALAAALGVLLALVTGAVLAVPAAAIGHKANGDLTGTANAVAQLLAEVAFFGVPVAIAASRGASFRQALSQLGLRRFRLGALRWMLAAIGAYLLFAIAYTALIGEPHQKDIVKNLGALPLQIVLIAIAAPICEETCFRGFLFGGLRTRLPRIAAALISGAIFGGLHATTGVSVVPLLTVFGVILALLYEKTGSIVPGILLHMLNNSVALIGR